MKYIVQINPQIPKIRTNRVEKEKKSSTKLLQNWKIKNKKSCSNLN
jgi:hypothetical protein